MDILNEIERYISSEEEMDNRAKDAKDIKILLDQMKSKGIHSVDDEKMKEILDDLNMDQERFQQLYPSLKKKIIGK